MICLEINGMAGQMMIDIRLASALFFAAIFCASQANSANNVASEERSTSDYDAVSVSGNFDIRFIDGEEGKLIIEGEGIDFDNIETTVSGETLRVKNRDDNRDTSDTNGRALITIPVVSVGSVKFSGSGSVTGSATLQSDRFDIQISGSGYVALSVNTIDTLVLISGSSNLRLDGKTNGFELHSSGSSKVHAFDFSADEAMFELTGSSTINTTVARSISSKISGSGKIFYRGNPEKLESRISGSGVVIQDGV